MAELLAHVRLAPHPVAATVGLLRPQVGRMLRTSLAMDRVPPDDPMVTRRDFPGLEPTAVAAVLARRSPG